jgi:methylated-DNA-[protein]-cysteine S-methyltransferase
MTRLTHLVAQRRTRTPLGPVLMARSSLGLAGLWFDGQAHHPGALAVPERTEADAVFDAAEQALADYFAGRHPTLPQLDPQGTPFQATVWAALRAIAPGQLRRYGELAGALGKPPAARAVGAAVGRNPISIFIPCHRVLGADGSLTGYAGGLDRKRALLALEGMNTA